MRRLDLKQRGVAPLEQELRNARSERESLSSELSRMSGRLDELEAKINEDVRRNVDREQSQWRTMRSDLEAGAKMLRERLATLDQRVIELENDLGSSRREILALEEARGGPRGPEGAEDARLGLR